MREKEPRPSSEPGEPMNHFDEALREFGSHLDDWYQHLQEEMPREEGMNVRESGLAHWLEDAEIPDEKKGEVLGLVDRYLRFVEETQEGDPGAIAAMERLKEKLDSFGS